MIKICYALVGFNAFLGRPKFRDVENELMVLGEIPKKKI